MKQSFLLIFLLFVASLLGAQSIGIGTVTPNPSAALEVSSTTQGMLIPRMTSAQREMISSPAAGLLVYDITTNTFWFRDNTSWTELVAEGDIEVHRNGPDRIYMGLTDSVGVGTSEPAYKLHVHTSDNQYGISHSTDEVDISTFASNVIGGWIGTRSNHPLNLYAGDGANQFTLLPNGNIGLGTTSPFYKLHLVGNTLLDGNVGIGTGATNKLDIMHGSPRLEIHPSNRPLYVTGDLESGSEGIEFRHSNGSQGIGFGFNTIYAAGNNTDHDLGMAAKGTGGSIFLKTNDVTRLFISGYGMTGIGTSNPGATLDVIRGSGVEGTARFLGTTHHSHFNYSTTENTFIRGGKAGSHVLLNDLAGQGNVGVGTGDPLEKLHVAGSAYVTDSVGIGTSTIGFPLSFSSALGDKISLWGPSGNHFGFGIGPALLQIHSDGVNSDIAFGYGNSASLTEHMRIKGNGRIGIGINPVNKLDINNGGARTGSHPTGLALYVTDNLSGPGTGIEFRHINGSQGIGFGLNTIYAAGSNGVQDLGLLAKGASGNLLFTTNNVERVRITGEGYIGIGTNAPNAPIQMSNTLQNRKLVLYALNNNDHEFFGFGVNAGGSLRYQTPLPANDHVFYAGTSPTTSAELARIKGNGNITVGGIIESETWIQATLGPNWSHAPDNPVMYYKDKLGRVHFQGEAVAGATPNFTEFFTMPAGYRPSVFLSLILQLTGGSADGDMFVDTDGYTYITNAIAHAYYSVSNISYRAN